MKLLKRRLLYGKHTLTLCNVYANVKYCTNDRVLKSACCYALLYVRIRMSNLRGRYVRAHSFCTELSFQKLYYFWFQRLFRNFGPNPMAISIWTFILVVVFGSCSWLGTNSVWMELPLLTTHLPEGWNLPSYLAADVQVWGLKLQEKW